MENLTKKPKKSILKSSSSFEQPECQAKAQAEPIKWDESNILETLHPEDKDYGHMKISEPKTPYSYYDNEDSGAEGPNTEHGGESSKIELSSIMKNIDRPARIMISSEPSDESEDEALSKEDRMKKKEFEFKRKLHYNEYSAVKLARKLLEQEEDESEGENATTTDSSKDKDSLSKEKMDDH